MFLSFPNTQSKSVSTMTIGVLTHWLNAPLKCEFGLLISKILQNYVQLRSILYTGTTVKTLLCGVLMFYDFVTI